MLYHTKESQLILPHTRIDYITFGRGEKPLIMIQGLNTRGIRGTAVSLAYMYRIFANTHRVYLFDRRPDRLDQVTVRDLAADLALAMDTLHISNADIFGVSQGGMIAQYLAIDRPDLVSKLVLAVTLSKNNDTLRNVIHTWIDLAGQGAMHSLIADMAEKMYSPPYIKRYRPFLPLLTLVQQPKDVQRFILLAKSCLTCNAYEDLEKIRCPVFVIGGRQDQVVSGKASEEIAEKLRCKLYMYDNLGHAAYEEAKDFNQKVLDFFLHG